MEQLHPLRRYRRDNGLSLDHLAALVGTTGATLSRIEARRQNASHDLLIRLSAETGISIDELVRAGAEAA